LAFGGFVGAAALCRDSPDEDTRRRIDVETHPEVFGWVLNLLANRGLLRGRRIGIDATTPEANAAMRSIVNSPLARKQSVTAVVKNSRGSTARRW
jgi:transposase